MKAKTLVVRLQPPPREEVAAANQEPPIQALKKESVEEQDEHGYEWPTPDDETAPHKMSIVLPNPSPSSAPLGKRKRKPKEIHDEISPIILRRKKKNASASKSKQVPNSGARSLSHKQEEAGVEGSSSPIQLKSPTMIRAEEVQASLGQEYPSFLKLLVRSHVASCFWMGLPVPFCKQYLPRKDIPVIIEDENGEQFEVKYFAEKTGLSAGWRKFVAAHKLVEGDVLIFQLLAPTKFKVYVIRANDLTDVDGALSLLNLDALTKQIDAEGSAAVKNKKRQKSLPLTVLQKRKQKAGLSRSVTPAGLPEEHSGNDSDEVASEVLEGSKFPGAAAHFKDSKSFEDFHIVVNGVCIDSELPEHIRRKYYELCCSKNAFLHDRLLPGLYCKLAAGMIFELVNTADAIRGCKLTTPRREFEVWDKSLRSFELLGMNVGFLRARLRRLVSLAFDSEGAAETKRYWEAKTERVRCEDEIRSLEAKLEGLKEASEKCDADIESLRSKAESYELIFQEEVNAPW